MRRLPVALAAALLLAACHAPTTARLVATPVAPAAAPARTAPAALVPFPEEPRRFVASGGNASLGGHVTLAAVSDPFFEDNAVAPFRLLDAMPSANALVTLSTLDDEIYTHGGQVLTTLTDAAGAYALASGVPADGPFVVNAGLAHGHRLRAMVLPGVADMPIDEASSMVVETMHWQLRTRADAPGQHAVTDATASDVAALVELSRPFVNASDFASSGPVPTVPALQQGAGLALRNLYVGTFGARVTAAGLGAADRLSDAWQALLGFRPLALTRVAGNGARGSALDEGSDATQTSLIDPVSATTDGQGNLYVTERNTGRVRMVPASDRGPLLGWNDVMSAGHLYTIGGVANGPLDEDAYNTVYRAAETAAVTDPSAAPLLYDPATGTGFPLFNAYRVIVEDTAGDPFLYVTTPRGHRVLFIPTADVTRYGRTLLAGHLYTLGGTGSLPAPGHDPGADDGQLGATSAMSAPAGIARDAANNLYVVDAGLEAQVVRVIRASDGQIFTLPLTLAGAGFLLGDANEIRLAGGYAYVACTSRHVVVRFALPDVAALSAGHVPAAAASVVLGQLDQPGLHVAGASDPAIEDAALPVPQAQVLLNSPSGLAFDASGNLLLSDSHRVRVLSAAGLAGSGGQVSTVAGGFATTFTEGDARLSNLPGVVFIDMAAEGNLLTTDDLSCEVQRLWLARGF